MNNEFKLFSWFLLSFTFTLLFIVTTIRLLSTVTNLASPFIDGWLGYLAGGFFFFISILLGLLLPVAESSSLWRVGKDLDTALIIFIFTVTLFLLSYFNACLSNILLLSLLTILYSWSYLLIKYITLLYIREIDENYLASLDLVQILVSIIVIYLLMTTEFPPIVLIWIALTPLLAPIFLYISIYLPERTRNDFSKISYLITTISIVLTIIPGSILFGNEIKQITNLLSAQIGLFLKYFSLNKG